jgi:predicted O-methyltransferase YrrM
MLFDEKIEKYILDHTESEDDVLVELYRQTHLKIYHPRMLSGHLQGKLLKMLVHMVQPKNILEIGTFTGYSAICMAQALGSNGKIHTIEVNDELEDFAKSFFKKANVEDKIDFYIGSALDIIPTIDAEFDLVFIDGEKREYLDYYNLVFDKVKKGGFIIADNVLWSGKVVEKVKPSDLHTKRILEFNQFVHDDPRVENVLFPLRDGLMILRKV